jgi:DnaJ like chaperone protein
MMKILVIIAALLYILFPWDILPDVLAGFGWLDDAVVLGLLIRYLLMQSRRHKDRQPGGTQQEEQAGSHESAADQTQTYDPHAILGVDRNASQEDIKKAYRRLVARYHPDKVSHLGDEFKELAERRFKEIQRAYQELNK